MHDGSPVHPKFEPAEAGASPHVPVHSDEVDGIVAGAMAATAAPPTPSRGERRRAERLQRAHAKAHADGAARTRTRHGGLPGSGGGGMSTTAMLLWGLLGIVAMGAIAVMSGAVQLGPPGTGPTDAAGGGEGTDTWSYYHDQEYDSSDEGAKWSTDRTRSSDPDEAVLGDTSRWEYDGPYRYGPYGSDGMRRRSAGRETADPLYSQPAPAQDVFSQYGGDLDPSGGQPVGVPPSSMTSPYYDPYGGYSNPYSNRIRMAYGEGVGRGASYAP